MIDIGPLLKQAGKVVAKNSPAILTAIGVTGTISTAIFAARGAFQAADVLRGAQEEHDQEEKSHPFDTKEKLSLTWKLYIPAAISAGMTVGAIIFANRISDKRAAVAASAYAFVEKQFTDYQRKTKEKLGDKKEKAMRDELAEDNFRARDLRQQIIITGKGSTNCFDSWSNRSFQSDMQTLRKAVNDFNCQVIADDFGSLTEFWSLIGLSPTDQSDNIGWTPDRLLELKYTSVLEDDEPHLCVTFVTRPRLRFDYLD
jgi:hypothetical protein